MEDYSVNIERHDGWAVQPGITTAVAALGVTSRSQSDIDAIADGSKIVYDLSRSKTEACLLRHRSDGSEDDQNVYEVYLGMKGDHYQRVATLTVDQGTQVDTGSIYFGDGVTPSNEKALFDGEEQTTTNEIGLYYLRTFGFDTMVIIASTLATTTGYVDKKDVGKA